MENNLVIFISRGHLKAVSVPSESKYHAIDAIREKYPVKDSYWMVLCPAELRQLSEICYPGQRPHTCSRAKATLYEIATWYARGWGMSKAERSTDYETKCKRRDRMQVELKKFGITDRVFLREDM